MSKKLINRRRLKNNKPKKMSLKKEDTMNKKLMNKRRLKNKVRLGNKVKPEKVSLKNDVNFKYFFKNSEKALMSLLKHFLPLPKKQSIKSVRPYLTQGRRGVML